MKNLKVVHFRPELLFQHLFRSDLDLRGPGIVRAVPFAAREKDVGLMEVLLDNGVKVEFGWVSFVSSLGEDCQPHPQTVKLAELLFRRGANIHMHNDAALKLAISSGDVELVRFLLNHGVDDIHPEMMFCAIFAAAATGNLDLIRMRLDHGTDIHLDNDSIFPTAAGLIAAGMNSDLLLRLVRRQIGKTVNNLVMRLTEGVIANNKKLDLLDLLLERGADVHARGEAALQASIACKHVDMVRFLLDRGANVFDIDGELLSWAINNEDADLAQVVSSAYNAKNEDNEKQTDVEKH
ncbi:hypothetical protein HK102_012988 [Quaeritorhiza haematococci]|nr:hypothetical protein HK102_012988 [Quaeritorhiza haematococci]